MLASHVSPSLNAVLEAAIIAAAFGSGETGALFLPDPVSVFQDSAGTTAGVVGQPAGLGLDKRLGLALGTEQKGSGVTGLTGTATAAVYNAGTGDGAVTRVDAANQSYINFTGLTPNGWYWCSATNGAGSAGTLNFRQGGPTTTVAFSVPIGGTVSGVAQASGSGQITVTTQSGTTAFTALSIRELPGNHVLQSTTTSRPTLIQSPYYGVRGDGADDSLSSATGGGGTAGIFLCVPITVNGGAGTNRTVWSDAGANTGYFARVNTANVLEFSGGNGAAFSGIVSAGTLPVGETHVLTLWDDGATFNVQIDNGAVASAARPAVAAGSAGFTLFKSNGGATQFLPGDLPALVYVKDSALTADRRAAIKRAIGAKVGISL